MSVPSALWFEVMTISSPGGTHSVVWELTRNANAVSDGSPARAATVRAVLLTLSNHSQGLVGTAHEGSTDAAVMSKGAYVWVRLA
jgi:hypothetical protein